MKTLNLVVLIVGSVIFGFLLLALIGYFAFSHEAASQLSQTTPSTTETVKLLTYENLAAGVRIKYPSDWEKNSQAEGVIVIFTSPKTDVSNKSAVLTVTTQDLSAQPMTLEEYTKLSLEEFKQLPSVGLLDSSATTLDGRPAHRFIYTMKVGQLTIKNMGLYTIKGNTLYGLLCIAEKSKYDEFSDDLQEMISSFEII